MWTELQTYCVVDITRIAQTEELDLRPGAGNKFGVLPTNYLLNKQGSAIEDRTNTRPQQDTLAIIFIISNNHKTLD
jgi:hypothetical protein